MQNQNNFNVENQILLSGQLNAMPNMINQSPVIVLSNPLDILSTSSMAFIYQEPYIDARICNFLNRYKVDVLTKNNQN